MHPRRHWHPFIVVLLRPGPCADLSCLRISFDDRVAVSRLRFTARDAPIAARSRCGCVAPESCVCTFDPNRWGRRHSLSSSTDARQTRLRTAARLVVAVHCNVAWVRSRSQSAVVLTIRSLRLCFRSDCDLLLPSSSKTGSNADIQDHRSGSKGVRTCYS